MRKMNSWSEKEFLIRTQKEVREGFWASEPELFTTDYKKGKKKNDYTTNIQGLFDDYIEFLQEGQIISYNLAKRVTL